MGVHDDWRALPLVHLKAIANELLSDISWWWQSRGHRQATTDPHEQDHRQEQQGDLGLEGRAANPESPSRSSPPKEGFDGAVCDMFVSKTAHDADYEDEIVDEHQAKAAVHAQGKRDGKQPCVPTTLLCLDVETAAGTRKVLELSKLQSTLSQLMGEYRRLTNNPHLPFVAVMEVLTSTFDALETCHRAHLIHRDFNLTNIMFPGRRGGGRLRAMLIDWTRSIILEMAHRQTDARLVGTKGRHGQCDMVAALRCVLSVARPTLTPVRASSSVNELTAAYEKYKDFDMDHREIARAAEKVIGTRAATHTEWIEVMTAALPGSVRQEVRGRLLSLLKKVEKLPFGFLPPAVYRDVKGDIATTKHM
ncbi:unnamed protein product [Vitrella brassicaformis CCMP3155]|uniref:Protein kinase domain-containing protein n=1 Tax=Vitrella brassicaformis (strain CCMP3155) TaxID=1169540 RepID=A0A0G4F203_VITBC|nr:unnamed protein product [Vitrella brassicaformis CCMP3155]|eukprot:CEM05559.1 unnamed protein product [Vitrella brassicaformis CCMP3155]